MKSQTNLRELITLNNLTKQITNLSEEVNYLEKQANSLHDYKSKLQVLESCLDRTLTIRKLSDKKANLMRLLKTA